MQSGCRRGKLCSPTRLLGVCCSFRHHKDSPRQRVVERVERDGRRDALHAEPPDVIVREEAEADLLHRMADHGPVVRHDHSSGCCLDV